MRIPYLLVAMLLLPISAARSQDVDRDEILRLGNTEQRLGDGLRAGGSDQFVEAMGLPAEVKDKWHITVVTTTRCAGCEQCLKAFATDENLRAFAKPEDPASSWANWFTVRDDDKSQMWRFKKIKFEAFPTILVQPPKSGRYGDSTTLVYQDTWCGDAKKQAVDIANAIRRYLESQAKPEVARRPGLTNYNPPYTPPKEEEPLPFVLPPAVDEDDRPAVPTKIPPLPLPKPQPAQVEPKPLPTPPELLGEDEVVVLTDPEIESDENEISRAVGLIKEHKPGVRIRRSHNFERYGRKKEEGPVVMTKHEGKVSIFNLPGFSLLAPAISRTQVRLPPLAYTATSIGVGVVILVGAYTLYRTWSASKAEAQPSTPD